MAGVAETGAGRVDGSGSEANKQLVHKPEEAPLEAFRRNAVCGHGCYSSSLLLGRESAVQPLLYGLRSCLSLI